MKNFRDVTNEDSNIIRKQNLVNPLAKHASGPEKILSRGGSMQTEELGGGVQRPGKGINALNAGGMKVSTSNIELIGPKSRLSSNQTQDKRSRSNNRMNEEDINHLYERHEKLLESLSTEEEDIIENHKVIIDEMIGSIKEDSELYSNLQSEGNKAFIRNRY